MSFTEETTAGDPSGDSRLIGKVAVDGGGRLGRIDSIRRHRKRRTIFYFGVGLDGERWTSQFPKIVPTAEAAKILPLIPKEAKERPAAKKAERPMTDAERERFDSAMDHFDRTMDAMADGMDAVFGRVDEAFDRLFGPKRKPNK
jgi:hypothetical protein